MVGPRGDQSVLLALHGGHRGGGLAWHPQVVPQQAVASYTLVVTKKKAEGLVNENKASALLAKDCDIKIVSNAEADILKRRGYSCRLSLMSVLHLPRKHTNTHLFAIDDISKVAEGRHATAATQKGKVELDSGGRHAILITVDC